MKTLGRFVRFTGITLSMLIGSLPFAATSFAGSLVVGYAPDSQNMHIIATIDFANGHTTASFAPTNGGFDGRGVEVVGNTVYYTNFGSPGDIHLAPYNNGLGGPDFASFSNPRPGFGIQDLDYSNGVLYALTGYFSGPPIVYALNPTNGHVLSSVAIQNHPGTAADGFTVLPNGDFLINDNDAVSVYRGYNPITGMPDGLVISVPGGDCTGVDYNSADNSLYYYCLSGFFGGAALARTDLTGTLLGSVPISYIFEDISVIPAATPEPGSLLLLGSGLLAAVAYGRHRLGL